MNPLFSLAAFLPLLAGIAWLAVLQRTPALSWLAGIGAGLSLWTLVEYGLHRFVHERVTRLAGGRPPHLGHHARPTDLAVMVTPLSFTLPAALFLWALLRLAVGDWTLSGIVLTGLLAGYFTYEVVHYSVHMSSSPGRLLRFWRHYHFRHHFENSKAFYGVTSPLWDYLFRTAARPKKQSPHDATSPKATATNCLRSGN